VSANRAASGVFVVAVFVIAGIAIVWYVARLAFVVMFTAKLDPYMGKRRMCDLFWTGRFQRSGGSTIARMSTFAPSAVSGPDL
jgi:hypothetical protein